MLGNLLGGLRRSVFTNTAALVLLRGGGTAARLVVLFLVARVVEPAEFGHIVFALTVVEVVRALVDFGVDTLLVREFAAADGVRRSALAGQAARVKLAGGLLGYLAVLLVCWLAGGPRQLEVGSIVGLLVITNLWVNLPVSYYQASLTTHRLLAPVLLTNLAMVAAAIAISLSAPGILAILVLPAADAVNAVILMRRLWREAEIGGARVELAEVRALLARCLPIAGTIILVTIYTRLDVFLLQLFFDQATLGFYGVAFRFTEPFQLVAVAFASSVYGHLAGTLARENAATMGRLVGKYVLMTLAYGTACFTLLALLGPVLIRWLLPEYLPAVALLRVLAAAVVFRTLNGCLTSVIQAYGRFAWVTGAATWNMVLIIALLLIFVPAWGALGAALAILTVEIVNSCVQSIMVRLLVAGHTRPPLTVETP